MKKSVHEEGYHMDSGISNKLNADPNNKTETAQQEDVEEHAMIAWETFDSSTIDNMEEEKLKADETRLEDAEDDESIFLWTQVEVS